MEITQKRNSTTTRFVFGDDELEFAWKDSSGGRSFSLPYTEISRDRQTLEERNQWLRNVGLIWIALGLFQMGMDLFKQRPVTLDIWLVLGAACYLVYRLRVTKFTIVPSEKGNILVIDDKDAKRIIGEIESRRGAQLRAEYDFVPEDASLEDQRRRLKWLHREGALSDQELQQRLALVDGAEVARIEHDASLPVPLLN